MRDITGTPISRSLGKIIDEAKEASTARYSENYKYVALLINTLTRKPTRTGTRITGWVDDTCARSALTLKWDDRTKSPILRLRKFDMDTDSGVEDIERRADADTFKELFALAVKHNAA